MNKNVRPMPITIICFFGFLSVLATMVIIASGWHRGGGGWYPYFMGLSAGVGLISFVGLWRMQRWAVYTYAGLVVTNQIVLLSMGVWGVASLIPLVVLGVAFAYRGKMAGG
ncbi:MAG: hypothetical protein HQL63_10730 [Magnetococcales bacterium]|nr:hypothetical protein [Magnetococcales bacterium]